jgi:hypothetical protein
VLIDVARSSAGVPDSFARASERERDVLRIRAAECPGRAAIVFEQEPADARSTST